MDNPFVIDLIKRISKTEICRVASESRKRERPGQPAVRMGEGDARRGARQAGEGGPADQLCWQVDCLLVRAFVDIHMYLLANACGSPYRHL